MGRKEEGPGVGQAEAEAPPGEDRREPGGGGRGENEFRAIQG